MYQTLLQDSYNYTQMRRMSYEDYFFSDASFSSQENSPLNANLDYMVSTYPGHVTAFDQQEKQMAYPIMYPSTTGLSWAPQVQSHLYQNYMMFDPLQSPVVSSQRMTPSLSSTSSSSSLDQYQHLVAQEPEKKKKSKRARAKRSEAPCATHHQQDTKQFPCDYEDCGKVFRRSEHLKRHIKSIHTREKPYECPYDKCGKRFSRTDNLSQHIRIHRPKKTNQQALSRKKN